MVAAWLGLGLGLLAVVLWVARRSEAATVQTVVYAVQATAKSPAPPTPAKIEPTRDGEPLLSKMTRAGNAVVWHPNAVEADGSYDVIIHFHGVQIALEPAMREAGLRAVLLIINDGLTAEAYRDGHGAQGTLTHLLDALHAHVASAFKRDDVHARRVALSAWSAGFGAISPMLRRADDVERIDAVLVSDGVHCSFVDQKKREILDSQLGSVVKFAQRAMARDKLFGITHTAIQTPDFASTTETAQKILSLLGLVPNMIVDPESATSPAPTALAERGDFVLLGFAGNDKRAHAVQQWALGRTLWARLAQRWNH